MLLLLLPLRAFGHGGTGKFIDRAIAAGPLEDPIAAGGKYPPPPSLTPPTIHPLPRHSPPPHPRRPHPNTPLPTPPPAATPPPSHAPSCQSRPVKSVPRQSASSSSQSRTVILFAPTASVACW